MLLAPRIDEVPPRAIGARAVGNAAMASAVTLERVDVSLRLHQDSTSWCRPRGVASSAGAFTCRQQRSQFLATSKQAVVTRLLPLGQGTRPPHARRSTGACRPCERAGPSLEARERADASSRGTR